MRRGSGGFTLIEIMLALGIFGLVAVTLYGTFSRTLRSKARAEERAEVTRVGRAAVGRMADEIASAYYPTDLPGTAIFRVLPGGSDDAPLDSLVFTALSARPAGLDGRATDQRMLAYFFARERSGLRRARRTGASASGEKPASDDEGTQSRAADLRADDADDFFAAFGPTPAPPLGAAPHRLLRREATMLERRALDEARATVFVDNVASLAFQFYDGRDWSESWDSEEANARLPRAVRIDLALYDPSGAIHRFATAVDLPLAARSGR
ncbi:MAG: prepilin-type N-terminal cleavage/methylation domain-containing protein [Deltaproteobacteria bacterium]|nr:prepilin-type N-terminal cleavage/methylation domain-containing protein [Deltaproteobacteria bacterium]